MSNSNQTISAEKRFDWPIVLFFALAYLIAWSIIPILGNIAQNSGLSDWMTLSQMGESLDFGEVDLAAPGWLIYLLTRLQDFSFSIAGIIVISILSGREGLKELWLRLTKWSIGWRWYLAAVLPFGLYALATVVSGASGSFDISGTKLIKILFSAEAGFLVYFFLRGAMGEELGLRGFALPRLQSRMSAFRASVIIGVLWGAWHIPVLLNRDIVSVIAFLLLALMLSIIFTWIFNGSGGSLIPVMIFHAAQNSEEIFEVLFPDLIGTDWELVSSLALLLIGLAVGVIVKRRRDGKENVL